MTIARLVADALKLQLYDDQRLQEKGIEMGLSSEDVKSLEEKALALESESNLLQVVKSVPGVR